MDERDILVVFGKKLQNKRREVGLTQTELAEKIGLSANFIGMVERGERNTKFANVYKLVCALGCSLENFFRGM